MYSRQREPEFMDQPDLDEARHVHALQGLARINRWSLTTTALFDPIARLAHELPGKELRVLDVASGGGDVAIGLSCKARRHGIRLQVTGCDLSPRAIMHARRRARLQGADVGFFVSDVLHEAIPPGYDVLTCSLFLHHLGEDEAVGLLRKMGEAAGRLVAVDDLRRHRAGMALALLGTQFLTRSRVVHADGLRSVRAAFTMEEAAHLAHAAGFQNFAVEPHWPFRFLLTWRKSLSSLDRPA